MQALNISSQTDSPGVFLQLSCSLYKYTLRSEKNCRRGKSRRRKRKKTSARIFSFSRCLCCNCWEHKSVVFHENWIFHKGHKLAPAAIANFVIRQRRISNIGPCGPPAGGESGFNTMRLRPTTSAASVVRSPSLLSVAACRRYILSIKRKTCTWLVILRACRPAFQLATRGIKFEVCNLFTAYRQRICPLRDHPQK